MPLVVTVDYPLSDDFNRVPIKVEDEVSHDSEAEDEEEYSSDEDDEVPTKYINASFVDVNGFRYAKLTQKVVRRSQLTILMHAQSSDV